MSLLHHPRVQHHAGQLLVCRVENVPGRFAMTFDDGPSAIWTPRMLDMLARHGARATFFTLGRNVLRLAGIARRALAEGHELGAHGWWHLPPPLLPPLLLAWEARRGVEAIERVTGVPPRLFRPPFGVLRGAQSRWLRAHGLTPVLGDVYPRDVERPGVDRIVGRVAVRLRAGSILILHDASGWGELDRSQSLAGAERVLEWARERGLESVTVSELLASPGARTILSSLDEVRDTSEPGESPVASPPTTPTAS